MIILSALASYFQTVSQKLSKSKASQQGVQADVLPRSVSRHFSARKTLSVSSVGSRGNTQLTQTVRRCFFNLFCLFKIGGWLFGLGRLSKPNAVLGNSTHFNLFAVRLFLKTCFVLATFRRVFGQSLFTNGAFFSNK